MKLLEKYSLIREPGDVIAVIRRVMAAYLMIFLYLISYAVVELYGYFVQCVISVLGRICQTFCAR